MTTGTNAIVDFFAREPVAIVAELTSVRGSSPREQGTFMLVGLTSEFGTIGGGALEYLVIEHARRLIRDGRLHEGMDVPLGPEIGQCCGGRVGVSLDSVTEEKRHQLLALVADEQSRRTAVFLFGAGHVGRALAAILALLPVKLEVVDTRVEELALLQPGISARLVAMPEVVVRAAPIGSAFVILTHDHALDFLIAQEALKRRDSPYIGMVGSATKRARFSSWYVGEGGEAADLTRLILPIGNQGLVDKRPEIIAALAAAEIIGHICRREAEMMGALGTEDLGAVDGR